MPVCDPHARQRFLRQTPVTSWSVAAPMWYKPPTPHPVTSLGSSVTHPAPSQGQPTRRASVQDLGTLHQRWAARRQSTLCRQSAVVSETDDRSESTKFVSTADEDNMSPLVQYGDVGVIDEGRASWRQHPPTNRRRKTVASLAIVTETTTQPMVSEWQRSSDERLQQQSVHQNSDKIDKMDTTDETREPSAERRQRKSSPFLASTTKTTALPTSDPTPNYHWQQRLPCDFERLSRDIERSPTVTSSAKHIEPSLPLRTSVSRRFSTVLGRLLGAGGTHRYVTGSSKLSISKPFEAIVDGSIQLYDEVARDGRSSPDDSTVHPPSTTISVPDIDRCRLPSNSVADAKREVSGNKLSKDDAPRLYR